MSLRLIFFLIEFGFSQDFSILIFPPPDVAFLLSLDSAGALYDRFVPSVLEAG